MDRIKKLLHRNIKLIIALLIFVSIGAGVTYSATTYLYDSNVIGYDNSNSGLTATDVQGALDELYLKINGTNGNCPSGYLKTQIDEYRFNCAKPVDLSFFAATAVRDDTSSTYVTSSTGIDFGVISSSTNGQGLYLLSSTVSDMNPIYYYRGAVENNNVLFANFCWKIVRTTETGGIKLIYNGSPTAQGSCSNTTGTSTQISTTAFNSTHTIQKYVGYTYDTNTNSTIKGVLDAWYKTNIYDAGFDDYIEDTIWCNDRSNKVNGTYSYYGAYTRLNTNKTPSLTCINEADRYTVNGNNGNGLLTYKVGLLTADELAYAGAVYGASNTTFYLYTNQWWWLMSPYSFDNNGACEFWYKATYFHNNSVNSTSAGARPALSLKSGVILNGSGTIGNPYTVSFN